MAHPPRLYRFTETSGAHKVRGCAAVYSEWSTCPDACPLKASGCYARLGKTALHAPQHPDRCSIHGLTLPQLAHRLQALAPLTPVRLGMTGDLPGAADRIAARELDRLRRACLNLRAWTYTHKPVTGPSRTATRNREALRRLNYGPRFALAGLTVNLSANNLEHADELAATHAGPVAVLLPRDAPSELTTPAGAPVRACPATHGGPGCIACHWCHNVNRGWIVGFRAHGAAAKQADRIARKETPKCHS